MRLRYSDWVRMSGIVPAPPAAALLLTRIPLLVSLNRQRRRFGTAENAHLLLAVDLEHLVHGIDEEEGDKDEGNLEAVLDLFRGGAAA